MSFLKKHIKTAFSRSVLTFFLALISVGYLGFYGYTHNEYFVGDEITDIENSKIVEYIIPHEIKSLYLSTTTSVTKVISPTSSSSGVTYTLRMATSTTHPVTVPVLVYHKISKPDFLFTKKQKNNSKRYSVQSAIFEAQMVYLQKEGYTPLTMKEVIRDKQNGTLPPKPIVVTFDDGWRSQYENALPVLLKLHISATFYIYTGVIGGGAYMTWDDLHDLVRFNMEIGGHTTTHPRLTKINPSALDKELLHSKIVLERNLHTIVSNLAYPYGDYDASIIAATKKYGYISGRTSRHAPFDDLSDLYQIKVLYAPDSLEIFKKMLQK